MKIQQMISAEGWKAVFQLDEFLPGSTNIVARDLACWALLKDPEKPALIRGMVYSAIHGAQGKPLITPAEEATIYLDATVPPAKFIEFLSPSENVEARLQYLQQLKVRGSRE
ncbi:MAG: hypothetical protein MUF49_26900 [Oculatellaceae cyanobacterium Prado106]|jgi:hypothetical protein|nr:hypothetical protein [Oculatellaceae cyanobacterium Prado106]